MLNDASSLVSTQENYGLLGYYSASSGNFLPTFWDTLSVSKMRIGCPEASARNYHHSMRNNPESAALIYFAAET
jgi:hypothetical protein